LTSKLNPGNTSGSLDTLKESFLTATGRIKWGALASSITGALAYAYFIGATAVTQAIASGLTLLFIELPREAYAEVGSTLATTLEMAGGILSTNAEFELFQLPVAVVALLVIFAIAAMGVTYLGD